MPERSFTIASSSINISGGRYKSDTPMNTAKKIANKLFTSAKINRIIFAIRETTKDSKKKTYTYIAIKKYIKKDVKITVRVHNNINKDVRGGSVWPFRDETKVNPETYDKHINAVLKFLRETIQEDSIENPHTEVHKLISEVSSSIDTEIFDIDGHKIFFEKLRNKILSDRSFKELLKTKYSLQDIGIDKIDESSFTIDLYALDNVMQRITNVFSNNKRYLFKLTDNHFIERKRAFKIFFYQDRFPTKETTTKSDSFANNNVNE